MLNEVDVIQYALREFTNYPNSLVWICGMAGNVIYANPSALNTLQLTSEQIENRPFLKYITEESLLDGESFLMDVKQDAMAKDCELLLKTHNYTMPIRISGRRLERYVILSGDLVN